MPYDDRLFGFLAGSVLTGAGVFYYGLEEYKVSNELLTEDIYVSVCIGGGASIHLDHRLGYILVTA